LSFWFCASLAVVSFPSLFLLLSSASSLFFITLLDSSLGFSRLLCFGFSFCFGPLSWSSNSDSISLLILRVFLHFCVPFHFLSAFFLGLSIPPFVSRSFSVSVFFKLSILHLFLRFCFSLSFGPFCSSLSLFIFGSRSLFASMFPFFSFSCLFHVSLPFFFSFRKQNNASHANGSL
jgi:hypothetical protein